MRVHILGICGTFMGGVAMLARQLGFKVSGADENVYPPMSDVLRTAGIDIHEGYDAAFLKSQQPDFVIIGNAISRGNPSVEYVLNAQIPYLSGPQWLAENALRSAHVLAVSGTHGKTTTASLLAWILQKAGLKPGYLIGGVPNNFDCSADLGGRKYFVIEADEYDSAFFDKRSKFLHYHPRTLIMNNLEYDHADIFEDLEAIKKQFHYLLRTVPGCGMVIHPSQDPEIADVLARGVWSATQSFGAEGVWQARSVNADGSRFDCYYRDDKLGTVQWELCGQHNIANALAAIAAAINVGVRADQAILALQSFKGVKRRLEVRGVIRDITVYDDFAHHPTAIATTLAGLRSRVKDARIVAVVEFGSYTMRHGTHQSQLAHSLLEANKVILLQPQDKQWDTQFLLRELGARAKIFNEVDAIVNHLSKELRSQDHVLIMSNKGFGGIHKRLLEKLQ